MAFSVYQSVLRFNKIMKFAYTLPILALAVNAAPTSNQQAVENVVSDLSSKGIDFFQNLADQYGVGLDVQAKVDQAAAAAENYYNVNKAAWQNEFQTWMSDNGYDTQFENWSAEAKKIRNRNKNKNPSQILDALTLKINGLTRSNVQNKELKKNLVAMTKQLKDLTKNAVSKTEAGSKKAKQLWKDAASIMEAQADKAIAEAQSQVNNL